jgi:cardiolipin synthase
LSHWLIEWSVAAWLAYLLVLSGWIVLQRGEPVATLGWIMALAAFPLLGFLIYYLLGPQRIHRRQNKRLRSWRALAKLRESSNSGPVDTHAIGRLGFAMTGYPMCTSTRVELLVDGGKTYDALVEAIGKAQRHIHLEYYIFAADRSGTRIRDALIERAKAGVAVRMLFDGVGTRLAAGFLAPLREAGVEIAWFHPVRWWLTFFMRPKLNMRCHRKVVVCDGRIGFTGGINVTDDEDFPDNRKGFHDLHLRIEGDCVRWLQLAWLEDWHYVTGRTLAPDDVLGPPAPGPILCQVIPAGPDNPLEPIHRMHVEAIYRSERRVWLSTPYFVPSLAALFALEAAAMRGLDVRLIVPKRSDSRVVSAAARSYFDALLKAGVKVYEYGPRMLHTKALLVDEDLALIGSSNFSSRSFRLNFELSVLFCDAGVAADLERVMRADFAAAHQRSPRKKKSAFLPRLGESVARLFSPLL